MPDDVISGLQHGTCTPDRYNYSSDIMMMSSLSRDLTVDGCKGQK